MKLIHFISLGCSKNLVDSERLMARLSQDFQLKITTELNEADIIFINTCAFLESAVKEALEVIFDASQNKKSTAKMIVAGCLPSRYKDELKKELAEADIIITPSEYGNISQVVAETLKLRPTGILIPNQWPFQARLQSTPFFRAYLKIAEGCSNKCTYCLIPKLRGPLLSYSEEFILEEAQNLVDQGVVELTLVAQDLTAYGDDHKKSNLLQLLKKLAKIDGLHWIRAMYIYPEKLSQNLIEEMAQIPKLLPYLDIPFQHASQNILKLMKRPKVDPFKITADLKKWWPELSLRTTLITGFPGETEEDFNILMDFVCLGEFDNLGVFKFSPEEESPASRLKNPVPQHLKEKRRRKIMALQKQISLKKNQQRVGETISVLVEGPSSDNELVYCGRASFQAPEVDGLVYFNFDQPKAGEIVQAKIVKASAYDLIAELK